MSIQSVTTKTVIKEYKRNLEDMGYTHNIRTIDLPELYEYERRIGKPLFEMTSDELKEMFRSIYAKGGTYNSINSIIAVFRNLFNFYINNYEIIINPFNSREWRGAVAISNILASRSDYRVTTEKFESMISDIRLELENFPKKIVYADYYECIFRLAYDGLICAAEYLEFKKDDVDFEKKTIQLQKRKIRLSDRTMELLLKVHNSDFSSEKFIGSNLRSYRGSYFKFICRNGAGHERSFDESKPFAISRAMNTKLNNVREESSSPYKYNFRELCILGFYDYLVSQYGEEKVRKMVLSERDSESAEILRKEAQKYEIPLSQNLIKAELLRYI